MRWKMRSAPERSTWTETRGYFASKALAMASETVRSTELYQTMVPSARAAATSSGVTLLGGGAARATAGIMSARDAGTIDRNHAVMRRNSSRPRVFVGGQR